MELAGDEFNIRQLKQVAELFGLESKNRYEVLDHRNSTLGYVLEKGQGVGDTIGRQLLGHWRRFELIFFDRHHQQTARAVHPFSWWFQRLTLHDQTNREIGTLQQKFSLLNRRFEFQHPTGEVVWEVDSPMWKPWTFPIMSLEGHEVASIKKQWSGATKELITDSDNFKISLYNQKLSDEERLLILAAGIFIDLNYFESVD